MTTTTRTAANEDTEMVRGYAVVLARGGMVSVERTWHEAMALGHALDRAAPTNEPFAVEAIMVVASVFA